MKTTYNYYFLCILLFLSITTNSFGQNKIGDIKIKEGERNITNLSGALNDSVSFHLIINKLNENKTFKTSVVFFDFLGKSKTILVGESEKKPNYLTFHSNGNIITLTKLLEESVLIQDIDYQNDNVSSTELNGIPINIFSHKEITILNFSRSLDLAFIRSSKDVQRNKARFSPGFNRRNFVNPDFNNTDFIDDTKFIVKGSIKRFKAFYQDDQLVIINDFKERGVVNIIFVSPDGILSSKDFEVSTKGKVKKLSSFIKNNLLFSFCMQKDLSELSIYDLNDLGKKKSFEYDLNDFGTFNKVVVNGNKKSMETLNSKRFLRSFFPQSVGSAYNPELYLSVNKTIESGYIIEVGHVDKNTYNNPNSGNFWWGNPAFQEQLTISRDKTQSANLSAVAGMAQLFIFNALAQNKRAGNYFELYLDNDLSPFEEKFVYEYEEFDTEKYKNRYEGVFKLRRNFFIPINGKVRLINFEKNYYSIYDID